MNSGLASVWGIHQTPALAPLRNLFSDFPLLENLEQAHGSLPCLEENSLQASPGFQSVVAFGVCFTPYLLGWQLSKKEEEEEKEGEKKRKDDQCW